MSAQNGFDFPRLHPIAADFHLLVGSSEILEISILQITDHVAGPVNPRTRLAGEGIGRELPGS